MRYVIEYLLHIFVIFYNRS